VKLPVYFLHILIGDMGPHTGGARYGDVGEGSAGVSIVIAAIAHTGLQGAEEG